MAEVLGQRRRRAAQGNRRGDDGLQEGARGDRRRPRAAMDWLRAKGLGKAGKLGDREATEGAVDVVVDGNVGVIVELNCNTDFVAKGAEFTGTCSATRQARRRRGRRRRRRRCRSRARPSASTLTQLAAKLGENVVARPRRALRGDRRPRRRATSTSRTTAAPSACSSSSAASTRPTRRRARSRTRSRCTSSFAAPAYLTRDEVPADVVERERAVIEEKSRNEGVPEDEARRARSRVGSTRSTRTSCCSSSRR